jgi:uncharacterized membrane protein (DUF4010 family)
MVTKKLSMEEFSEHASAEQMLTTIFVAASLISGSAFSNKTRLSMANKLAKGIINESYEETSAESGTGDTDKVE